MTEPEQVRVNVADLRKVLFGRFGATGGYGAARGRLVAIIKTAELPEAEWEPTDDMRAKYRRALELETLPNDAVDVDLRALHREGLL